MTKNRAELIKNWFSGNYNINDKNITSIEELVIAVEANTRLECQQEIAQLKELVREATKMDWTWSITQNKKWLAKAKKALEGK